MRCIDRSDDSLSHDYRWCNPVTTSDSRAAPKEFTTDIACTCSVISNTRVPKGQINLPWSNTVKGSGANKAGKRDHDSLVLILPYRFGLTLP